MSVDHDLSITYVAPEQLEEWPGNARRGDVPDIAASMRENGVFAPLTVQRSTGRIVIGNHRYMALQALWDTEPKRWARRVPVIYIDVDDATAERINLRDNKSSDNSGWDDAALLAQLTSLYEDDMGSLLGSGFTDAEYTQMLLDSQQDTKPPARQKGEASLLQNASGVMTAGELGDSVTREDNTMSTPPASKDYRALVYLDSKGERDELVARLRAEGYNASAVG